MLLIPVFYFLSFTLIYVGYPWSEFLGETADFNKERLLTPEKFLWDRDQISAIW